MATYRATILWLDTWEEEEIQMFEELFEKKGLVVIISASEIRLEQEIRSGLSYDLFITNLSSPNLNVKELLRISKELYPSKPVMVYSTYDFHSEEIDAVLLTGSGLRKMFETIDNLLAKKQ